MGKIESVDVVRWQDGKVHVLGRGEETVSSDSVKSIAYHIIHDDSTGKVVSEKSFMHRGSFPLFMCGCYMLSCEGDCPPILDRDLAVNIHEYLIRAKQFDETVKKFRDANLKDLKCQTGVDGGK